MRTVLYTNDMEPITVLELRPWQVEHLERHRMVTLAVMPEANWMRAGESLSPKTLPYVRITAEWFRRGNQQIMLLFTRHEENAMLLDSEFLPGQRRLLREKEREAFGRGVLAALNSWSQE